MEENNIKYPILDGSLAKTKKYVLSIMFYLLFIIVFVLIYIYRHTYIFSNENVVKMVAIPYEKIGYKMIKI